MCTSQFRHSDHSLQSLIMGNLTLLHANNNGANKPAHSRSLISTVVIRLLQIMISAKFQYSI